MIFYPPLVLAEGEEPGRAFYESKAAMATYPWSPWDKLHQWERDREALGARARAGERWIRDHPDATGWPAEIPPVRWNRGEPHPIDQQDAGKGEP